MKLCTTVQVLGEAPSCLSNCEQQISESMVLQALAGEDQPSSENHSSDDLTLDNEFPYAVYFQAL